jgi:hypothetical protein
LLFVGDDWAEEHHDVELQDQWDLSNRDQPRPLGVPLTGHTNAVIGHSPCTSGAAAVLTC